MRFSPAPAVRHRKHMHGNEVIPMMQNRIESLTGLKDKCFDIREMIIRYINATGVGHVGGSLSMVELAVALYYNELNYDFNDPHWAERDRVVISKGHCCDTLAAIFIDRGLYTFETVKATYEQGPDTIFSMHPCKKFVPYYEASTGALGHGMSIAAGMALAARQYGEAWRTFCFIGDGELDEGSNWEAFMVAAHQNLGKLVCILDANQLQMTGFTKDILEHKALPEKMTAFGWNVEVCDGNDMADVLRALRSVPKAEDSAYGKPTFILANTVKGKGVDFMEGLQRWHGGGLSDEDTERAIALIEKHRREEI